MIRSTLFLLVLFLISCASSVKPGELRTSSVANRRWKAARLIGADRRADMMPALLQSVRSDPVPLVRAQSAVAIGQLGRKNERVYSTLSSVLKNDPSPLVQQDVLTALARLDYKKAVPLILNKLAKSPEPDVRAEAARALNVLGEGGKNVFSSLVRGLDDRTYRVQTACHRALESITGKSGPMETTWWKKRINSLRASEQASS